MKRLARSMLNALTVVSLALTGGCVSNVAEARADARRDIRRGELELRVYGLPTPASKRYESLLKSHLGVNVRTVGSCVMSEESARDADAYNEVMRREIEARHGRGVLTQLRAAAESEVKGNQ